MQLQDSFLDELRRPRPDPGGGAAAAHGALLGVALAEKIILVEQKRAAGKGAEHSSWESALRQTAHLMSVFTGLRDEDVQAYHHLTSALRSGGDPARLQEALDGAIRCPLRIMEGSRDGLTLVENTGRRCNRYLVADVLVACEFLGAALLAAYHIGLANIPLIENPVLREKWRSELYQELQRGRNRLAEVRAELEVRNAAGGR